MILSKFSRGQMSDTSKSHQNAFKMSDHLFRSNGLADESFLQTQSNTSTDKVHQNSVNHQIPSQETQLSGKRKCSTIKCPLESHKKTDDIPPPLPLSSSEAPNGNHQTSQQSLRKNSSQQSLRKNIQETSSHTVSEVVQTVNHILSYEEEAMNKIEKITKDIEKMYQEMVKVDKFDQMSEYKKFEEFFLQKNIELDNVDPKDNEEIREFRRAAVRYVQDCMYNLDQKQNEGVEL